MPYTPQLPDAELTEILNQVDPSVCLFHFLSQIKQNAEDYVDLGMRICGSSLGTNTDLD